MFAGHYTTAFVAKAAEPRTPLWVLLLAAQFVDVLWVLCILAGIEHARLDPSLASNPLDLYDMPWTHSLAGTAAWSAVAYAGSKRALRLPSKQAALVAAVTASHWFLDLVVHRPDLTIAGGTSKLGLAIWNYPMPAYLLEVALVVASVALATRASTTSEAQRGPWLRLGAALVLVQTAITFGPLPPSLDAMATTGLVFYGLVAAGGWWVDRRTAAAA